jgi:hypothetical protein
VRYSDWRKSSLDPNPALANAGSSGLRNPSPSPAEAPSREMVFGSAISPAFYLSATPGAYRPAHHAFHISRNATSIARVNPTASITGEPCMRARSPARIHFQLSNVAGPVAGRNIGNEVANNRLR